VIHSISTQPVKPNKRCYWVVVLSIFCALSILRTASASERLEVMLRGPLTQGALILGKSEPGVKVWLNGEPIRVSDAGDFVFGFGRDEPLQHTLKVESRDGRLWEEALTLEARSYRIQRVEGIKKEIMSPSEEDLKRIREDVAQVKAARKTDDNRLDFLKPLMWPIKGPITGVYGSQRFYNGVPKRPHYGVDIAAPTGTEVKSPGGGVITLAHPDMFYSGGTLILDHGFGVSSTFLHLSKLHVKEGDLVEQGDLIGEVGSAGRSTGPHLDWRMNWFNRRIDVELMVEGPPE